MNVLRWIATAMLCMAIAPAALGACKIGQIAEIPVSIVGNRLLLDGKINGQGVKIFVDTGAQWTSVWEDAATRLGLPLQTHTLVQFYGVDGGTRVFGTVIEHFEMGTFSGEHLRLAVVPTSHPASVRDAGRSASLVLGDDFLSKFTTEFDLAHGVIRLLRPEGCQPDEMTYWSDTYSMAELRPIKAEQARIQTEVLVNGVPVTAVLDSGAPTSVIALRTAANVGVTAGKAGTVAAGSTTGIAGKPMESWIGTFASFSIGDEAMKNVKLRVADIFTADTTQETGSRIRHPVEGLPSMLVGCDFFLSHRILILAKEHKLLFTYNGGPVFQFVKSDAAPKDGAGKADNPPAPAAATATP